MAAKKKATNVSVKAKPSKVAAKSRTSSKKKSGSTKREAPVKNVKKKNAVMPKKSRTKTTTSAAKKAKPTSSKKKAAAAPQPKKKKSAVSKRKAPQNVAPSRTPAEKKRAKPTSAKAAKAESPSKGLTHLSPQERYNVGGLCACVIETSTNEGQARLQRLLMHLGLSDIDQANLFRVSQGLRIPKLFADGLSGEDIRRAVLQGLTEFAQADDPSGKRWRETLEDFKRLLGT